MKQQNGFRFQRRVDFQFLQLSSELDVALLHADAYAYAYADACHGEQSRAELSSSRAPEPGRIAAQGRERS